MHLETPWRGQQHLWVLDRGIVKRLRLLSPPIEQLRWLVLANANAVIPVEGTVERWDQNAFESVLYSVHVLPHTQARVPGNKPTAKLHIQRVFFS